MVPQKSKNDEIFENQLEETQIRRHDLRVTKLLWLTRSTHDQWGRNGKHFVDHQCGHALMHHHYLQAMLIKIVGGRTVVVDMLHQQVRCRKMALKIIVKITRRWKQLHNLVNKYNPEICKFSPENLW